MRKVIENKVNELKSELNRLDGLCRDERNIKRATICNAQIEVLEQILFLRN